MKKEEKKVEKKKEEQKGPEKITKFNLVFVDLQILITICTIVIAVLYMFNKVPFKLFQLSLGINLLMIAFNNYKIYKRSRLTVLYAVVGVIILICLAV